MPYCNNCGDEASTECGCIFQKIHPILSRLKDFLTTNIYLSEEVEMVDEIFAIMYSE